MKRNPCGKKQELRRGEKNPSPFKNDIWRRGVVLKLILKFQFCIFLNDQHSTSFHIIGLQMRIKYMHLDHVSDWSSTCVGVVSLQKLGCCHHTCAYAQGLLGNVTLKFHLRGWITSPGFPSKKKEFDRMVLCLPAFPLYRGRIEKFKSRGSSGQAYWALN